MTQDNAVKEAVDLFSDDPIAELTMQKVHGSIDGEPRTLQGIFPGTRTRAMGHALSAVEMIEEEGIEAEHEHVEQLRTDPEFHRIDVHVAGGNEDNVEEIDDNIFRDN